MSERSRARGHSEYVCNVWQSDERAARANEQADKQKVRYSTRRFHKLSAHCALARGAGLAAESSLLLVIRPRIIIIITRSGKKPQPLQLHAQREAETPDAAKTSMCTVGRNGNE